MTLCIVTIMDDKLPQEEQEQPVADSQNQAAVLLSLEELIKNHIDSIDKMRNDLRQVREMFDDSFGNNPTYREATEQAQEAAKKKNKLKQEIAKQPSVAQIPQKIKDPRFDLSKP